MVSLFPHPASFRFRLTTDTLAFGYLLPATGRIRVFHPLETCAAGRTQKAHIRIGVCLSFLYPLAIPQPVVQQLDDDFFHLFGCVGLGKILFQRIVAQRYGVVQGLLFL